MCAPKLHTLLLLCMICECIYTYIQIYACVCVLVCVTELKGVEKEKSPWTGGLSRAGDCPEQEPKAWAQTGLSVPLIP